jgi:hypothetical protein
MKRLIRNQQTKAYLAAGGGWTTDHADARSFESVMTLITEAVALPETALEEVLMMGEEPSGFDVILPLGKAERRAEVRS